MNTSEQQAIAFLSRERGRPFVWGETDCVTLTFRALDLWTGRDISGPAAGLWADAVEALEVYRRGVWPTSYLKQMGAEEIAPNTATTGDVIAIPSAAWPEQLHFVAGRYSMVSDETRGVCVVRTAVLIALDHATAWRVPCRKPSH